MDRIEPPRVNFFEPIVLSFCSSLLHDAAWHRILSIAPFLLKRGAIGDAANAGGITPLHGAAMRGHFEVTIPLI